MNSLLFLFDFFFLAPYLKVFVLIPALELIISPREKALTSEKGRWMSPYYPSHGQIFHQIQIIER